MSLTLNNLQPKAGSAHRRKRLGRGNASGHGAYSTRGIKGQRARQGGRKGLIQLGAKHFVSHLPKVRGFQSFKVGAQVVNVAELATLAAESRVTAASLLSAGLIVDTRRAVKLMGNAKLPKLTVTVQAATAGARAAIAAAGGSLELKPLAVRVVRGKLKPKQPKV